MTGGSTTRRARSVLTLAAIAALVVVGACSEPEPTSGSGEPTEDTVADGSIQPQAGDGTTVISRFAGASWFAGDVPDPSASDPAQPPVKVGFMNVDSAPVGAMPELHTATDGAAAFINAELGGVNGRPIEIVSCLLSNALAPDEAQGCARKFVSEGVVAVLGGIGLANGAALAVLEENGIPWVGGIPVNNDEMTSPVSFQFSGGSPGAFAAFAEHAVETDGAKRVSVLYAEFPSIAEAALDYGAAVAEKLGADVETISFPLVSQDFVTPVQKAVESDPDAIFVGAADLACAPIMQALSDLRSDATIYMVGSCADQKQVDKVGADKVAGFRFNIESRLDQTASPLADTEIYTAAMEKYAPTTSARGAATVSFRSAMNLWRVLNDLSEIAAGNITTAFREAIDQPSFDGHPYTCEPAPIPDLPALCAAHEVIVELSGPNAFAEVSDGWIDVPAVVADTGTG